MNPIVEKINLEPNVFNTIGDAKQSTTAAGDVTISRPVDSIVLLNAAMSDVVIEEVPEQESDRDVPLVEYTSNYLEMYMTDSYLGVADVDDGIMESYRDMFSQFITDNFDAESVMDVRYPDQELYNPVLQEFAGILASVDHNAGIYYGRDEVEDVFKAISGMVVNASFKDETTDKESGDSENIGKAIKSRVKELMSISNGQSMALIKDEDGAWKAIDHEYTDKSEDFAPLEVTRQDNEDKGGKNKYRFRKPLYTKSQSHTHSKRVAEGWYTREWLDDPSYWSGELRALLTDVATDTALLLDETNSNLVFISEGGIFKGTSTAETDIDTACFITCNSTSEFDGAFETVTNAFNQRLDDVPFATKEDPLRPTFYDRTTKTLYHRHEDGSYTEADYEKLVDGDSVLQTIRKNEKGLAIVTRNGLSLHSKSEVDWDNASLNVAVNLESGSVVELSEEKVRALKAKPKASKQDMSDLVW